MVGIKVPSNEHKFLCCLWGNRGAKADNYTS
ncbi:hypothetical protein Hamer_G004257 [Homarus americanus]|uniref:Uncharacterized protein n=1 Tax=Homarus americanus TaxID=6706 RepID=A0A8J5JK04_HOMAM|nr:hypothetical protein Hamer_G004257 [Homarus americanus]